MKNIAIALTMLLSGVVMAQDAFFSQQNFGWAMINPGYAGSLACGRAETGYRLQWPKIAGGYQTFNAAYDQYFKFGGVGFNYMHDDQVHAIKTDRFDFDYAYPLTVNFSFSRNAIVFQPGIQVSYQRKSIDWTKLTFGDMIDPRRGFVYNTAETPNVTAKNNIDFSAGLLLYSKRFVAGASVFHITEPDEGFLGPSKLPMRYVTQAAILLGNADPLVTGLSVIPSVVFMKQETFQNLVVRCTVKYGDCSVSTGYRNQDAVIFGASYSHYGFTLGYSYDLTVSKLNNAYSGGSHEIHLAYCFGKEQWSDIRTNLQMFF
jgi:type IX secretion system PorP/SprF family membrane protein